MPTKDEIGACVDLLAQWIVDGPPGDLSEKHLDVIWRLRGLLLEGPEWVRQAVLMGVCDAVEAAGEDFDEVVGFWKFFNLPWPLDLLEMAAESAPPD